MSKTLKKNLTEYNLEKRREIIKQRKLESDLILNKYRYFIIIKTIIYLNNLFTQFYDIIILFYY